MGSSTPVKFKPNLERPEETSELTTRPRRTHLPTLPSETDSTHSLPSKESSSPPPKPRDTPLDKLSSKPREPRPKELERQPEPLDSTPSTKDSKTPSRPLRISSRKKRDKVTTFQETPLRMTSEPENIDSRQCNNYPI